VDCGRPGNYYLVNSFSHGRIRLNRVADYHCTEAAISDRIPLHGAAAFRCIQHLISKDKTFDANNYGESILPTVP
jgi:hypothetical protein